MVQRRTVDLLPEIFRTPTNRQFLAATLDQLTAEPQLRRTQGWIGRRVGPGVQASDDYVLEPTAQRANYQLEPGIVQLRPDTNTVEDAMTYPGILDALATAGADVSRADRLFRSEYYAWDSFCDLDKFSNYSQYYWLPDGPNPVDVSQTLYPVTDSFEVARGPRDYTLSGLAGGNPTVTLVRGGNYTFEVNQLGSGFWIQVAPGITGRLPQTPNISGRDVLGVVNNGTAVGTVQFNVPDSSAQDFYYTMPSQGEADLASLVSYSDIAGSTVSGFLDLYPRGIDGITDLEGRTLVFVGAPDPAAGGLDQNYSVWNVIYDRSTNPNDPTIVLTINRPIPQLTQIRINAGDVYSSTRWFRDAVGQMQQMPLLTAANDLLYYQDGTDPDRFGIIRLIDPEQTEPLDAQDIIGAREYVSPNGVRFTNGLKIQFRGRVNPASWTDQEFYVEGVGTGPGIAQRVGFIAGEGYWGDWHWRGRERYTGAEASATVFQLRIWDTLEESLANPTAGEPQGAPLPNTDIPGSVAGLGIRLIPVSHFITPETYNNNVTIPFDALPFDVNPYDEALNYPDIPDYLTINRASRDRNPWSRCNRWFHIDVLAESARLNNQPLLIDDRARARRPIIEFRADLRLFNTGTLGRDPVNIIDFAETDAFSNINGQPVGTVPAIDGYDLGDGSLVIFAADLDPAVRDRVYRVDIIDPDGITATARIINLVPLPNGQAHVGQQVVCLGGETLQGVSFRFDGVQWIPAQAKTQVNQAPRFDVYDSQGRSFGDTEIYPASTFAGSRLFGYALGTGSTVDPVLGFALRYENINNVGDIVFTNDLYTDTFIWVDGTRSITVPVSTGRARQYANWIDFNDLLGWLPAAEPSRSRQTFRFRYDGAPLLFDVPMSQDTVNNPLQLYAEGRYLLPSTYTVTVTATNTTVTLDPALDPPALGTAIEAQIISDVASAVGFYQVPLNLENNPFNENSTQFTLGTIRNHYSSIAENLRDFVGDINGINNSRDLGLILTQGTDIVQHSSPLTLAGVFLRQQDFDLFSALRFNSQEYEKYKARLIDAATRVDFTDLTPSGVLDEAVAQLAQGRNPDSPFYWSDMLPSGQVYTELQYTVGPLLEDTFDISRVYDFTVSNFQALLVWLNGNILARGPDYTVGPDTASITVTVTLTPGDSLVIREYSNTAGNFVPNTPTKMGLYPASRPEMYLDTSAVNPTMVIRGHDGSITRAWGDVRDQILLEFETRIFNNLKTVGQPPLSQYSVVPGRFRTTDYSLADINRILNPDFLSYVAWNKLDYVTQQYLATEPDTYNYSQSGDRLTGAVLLGAWRGIYQYFYDTTAPNLRPWEMLGLDLEPDWWQGYYGPPPYTSGNLVLWTDLEQGLIRDPQNPRIAPGFVRPGLTQVIPSDSEGGLASPLDSVVGRYDATSFRRSWTFGDGGPVEASWRNSSSWPFAVMRLLALTRPAQFFSLFADRDRYRYDANLQQFLWQQRYRLEARELQPLYGDGTSRASYIDWIIDYNRQLGADSTQDLTQRLASLDIRLCWRAAGFTDKRYLKVRAERSTPGGGNTSLLLPDESWQVLLYRNTPSAVFTYSAVIVQATTDGWAVLGYNSAQPFFNILVSRALGPTEVISAGNTEVRVPRDRSNTVVRVPYGYVFTSRAAVCDFLISYGALLEAQGWQFEGQENGLVVNWRQMAQEFLYWSNQGWVTGSIINLNPGAVAAVISRPGQVADNIRTRDPADIILNQNRQPMRPQDLTITRLGNTFRVESRTSDTLCYVNVGFTAWENLVVFDNTSIFSDVIYQPRTGSRQSRLGISGWISDDWNGEPSAQGWIINQDTVRDWSPNRSYTRGDIVLFKDRYYAAADLVPPSQNFDPQQWLETEYQDIQTGMLPNAANAADQLAQAYDIYAANLEGEVNLFSYGLTGFRPREYMSALELDDVSQLNIYQQFLGSKGTRSSLEIFSQADLGREVAQYNIYENWAMLRAQYGATASRAYFELRLNEALLTSDPSVIQVIDTDQPSEADQTVTLAQVWKQSYRLASPQILPTIQDINPDRALPSAGYVNPDDVDISVFNLTDRAALSAQLDTIGVGTTVWVAAINPHEWNIYRVEAVPANLITLCDNLDGRSLAVFSAQHDLQPGDTLIVRYFDLAVDGVYTVRTVPNLTSVLIDYVFEGQQTEITGLGLAMTLGSARVASPNLVNQLPYSRLLTAGARVWVDNNGSGLWEVIEKQDPFVSGDTLVWDPPRAASGFGSAVSQGTENLTALVGAPQDTQGGQIYSFIKTPQGQYAPNSALSLPVANTLGYGHSIDIGDQSWAVAGAPNSLDDQGYAAMINILPGGAALEQTQLLLPWDRLGAAVGFGTSVTMSQDERWTFVSAPQDRQVYAWIRVDVPQQGVNYVGDGSTSEYNWSDSVVIDPNYPNQLIVTVDDTLIPAQVPGQPNQGPTFRISTTDTDNIEFLDSSGMPVVIADQAQISIGRRTLVDLDSQRYLGVTGTVTASGGPSVGTGAAFSVTVQRGVYSVFIESPGQGYNLNDRITVAGNAIGGGSNLVFDVTRTGNAYSARGVVGAGATVIAVVDSTGLGVGQEITRSDGTATLASGTTITDINTQQITGLQVTDQVAAESVVARSTAAIADPLAAAPLILDQLTLISGDRVLLLNQADLATNGIYRVVTAGSGSDGVWTRIAGAAELNNTVVAVTGPTPPRVSISPQIYAGTQWLITRRELITVSPAVTGTGTLEFLASPGPITSIAYVSGSSVGNTAVFSLTQHFLSADNIYSFSVTVDDVLQRPGLDYTFASGNLSFEASALPAPGAAIQVRAGTYWATRPEWRINTDLVPSEDSVEPSSEFGHSISTTTPGQQLIVGAPATDITVSDDHSSTTLNSAGATYVFDRAVERSVVTDPTATTITTQRPILTPTAVTVNGQSLPNLALQPGPGYRVTGANTVQITLPLAVGDVIEVSTNQWQFLQRLEATTPFELAQFGYRVDQCVNDCSLYVSAPWDSTDIIEAGSVEFWNNQARVYGTTTSLIDDPTLTPGQTLRVNLITVTLSSPRTWSLGPVSGTVWPQGTFVINSGDIYRALRPTPAATALTDAEYWEPSSWLAVLAQDIELAVPNVLAAVSDQRLTVSVKNFSASVPLDRLSVLPGTGTLWHDVGFETYVWQQRITAPQPQTFAHFGQGISISDNTTTLTVGAPDGSMIRPVTFDNNTTTFDAGSTLFTDIEQQSGAVYVYDFLVSAVPSITEPGQFVFGQQLINNNVGYLDRFGQAVDYTTGVLLAGAPHADIGITDSGAAFLWQNFNQTPAWAVIRQQTPVVDINMLNSVFLYDLATGSPQAYLDYFDPLQGRMLGVIQQNVDYTSTVDPAAYNQGTVNNWGQRWAQEHVGEIWWDVTRVRFIDPHQDQVVSDSRRWGQLFPGSLVQLWQWVASDLPPAQYTGPGQPRDINSYSAVSEVDAQGIFVVRYYFWVTNLRTVSRDRGKTLSIETLTRYIENPRGSGIAYMAPVAPGTLALYNCNEYISAQDTVLHVEYDRAPNSSPVHQEFQLVAQGRAQSFLDDSLYSKLVDSLAGVDATGLAVPDPMLPVSELYGIAVRPRQSMFADRFAALENYLTRTNDILAQVPAAENRIFDRLERSEPTPSSVAYYQSLRLLTTGNGTNTIVIPVALTLILPSRSRVVVNGQVLANSPPDASSLTYQFLAGATADVTRVVFSSAIEVGDEVQIDTSSLEWNLTVADYQELLYQDLSAVPQGYRYLVLMDSTNNSDWSIYSKVGTGLRLERVESYNTRRYWSRRDWYQPGFNPRTRIAITVPNTAALDTITVPTGAAVRVEANAQNRWEIYLREAAGWRRVALQDGTIEFSSDLWDYRIARYGFDAEVFDAQYFDESPTVETRNIIEAINQEIMTGDLLIHRNRLLTLMFEYIMTEQITPGWLNKTSLIDVDHVVGELAATPVYRTSNQDFVTDYINEVKPYHTKIREFNLIYDTQETAQASATDFDVPAVWNAQQNQFISPILDDTGSTPSSRPDTDAVWQTQPYRDWYENFTLQLEDITVVRAGQDYTVPPEIIVGTSWQPNTTYRLGDQLVWLDNLYTVVDLAIDTGISGDTPPTVTSGTTVNGGLILAWAGVSALAVARITAQGQLSYVTVARRGSGYITTPTIEITGGNGTGAVAAAVTANSLVRSITTRIRFDRVSYSSDIQPWQAQVIYTQGDRVRYNDRAWRALVNNQNAVFDPNQWTVIPAGDLTAGDRVAGYYSPTADMPGQQLNQVMTGIDYPGVQVMANDFDGVLPLDAIYESEFTDTALGTRARDITVVGGAFVDTYSSHAPEEFVPGLIFDAWDMVVSSTPGSDWLLDGHGAPVTAVGAAYRGQLIDFSGASRYPAVITVLNQTQGTQLYINSDFAVDWVARTIEFTNAMTIADGDQVTILVWELGGGNQLYRQRWAGEANLQWVEVPVGVSTIDSVAVWVNGQPVTGSTLVSLARDATRVMFPTAYDVTDSVTVTVFGVFETTPGYTWSVPQQQTFVSQGTLQYLLGNSLRGTNPANIVVERNGQRLRAAEGARYISDGTTLTYDLPSRGGYTLDRVQDGDVDAYVDDVPLTINVDFTLDPWDGSSLVRTITLFDTPAAGAEVLISVSTASPYYVSGDLLIFKPTGGVNPQPGDVLSVTTWNDTRQQDIVTLVFQGPSDTPLDLQVTEGFDSTGFDYGDTPFEPGSFEYSTSLIVKTNQFDTGREILEPNRLLVSLDGRYLTPNRDFEVRGSVVVLAGPVIGAGSVVVITAPTQSALPGEMTFRIFQDLRGQQTTYRILPETSTLLTQPLTATGDVITVADARRLPQPNLTQGQFGDIMIQGERITYRVRDLATNTLSGLRRGVAGTGAATHPVGAQVSDITPGQALEAIYQDHEIVSRTLGDGTTEVYSAPEITVTSDISLRQGGVVSIDLDGDLLQPDQYSFTAFDPVQFSLVETPAPGAVVTLTVEQITGVQVTQSFTATGFTNAWTSSIVMAFETLLPQSYTVQDFSPVVVEVGGLPRQNTIFELLLSSSNPAEATQTFQANGLSNLLVTEVDLARPVTVRIGGITQGTDSYSVQNLSPVQLTLAEPAPAGVAVDIAVRRGLSWYQPGVNTASDGVPLQETQTTAARFLRGQA